MTDKPIKYVVLSHYHAVRVLGASAYKAQEIIASDEMPRHDRRARQGGLGFLSTAASRACSAPPRPSRASPGRRVTFKDRMTLYLGKRRVELALHRPRPHRRRHRRLRARTPTWSSRATSSSTSRPATAATRTSRIGRRRSPRLDRVKADALVPGRGDALVGVDTVAEGIALTRDFLRDTLRRRCKRGAARGAPLKECFDEATAAMRPKYGSWPIFEHCQPFNIAARLRRGAGHRHTAHLDGGARPRHVGSSAW